MPDIRIVTADCLDALRDLPENSLEACLTDPPYGLSDHDEEDVRECMAAWLQNQPYAPKMKGGFMGANWDAFVPGPEVWREVYRTLKPGAFLACFASTRTADLMSLALRLAGFRKHTDLVWIFGSGFPKATNLAKQIDRLHGIDQEVVGIKVRPDGSSRPNAGEWQAGMGYMGNDARPDVETAPATDEAKQWDQYFYGLQAIKPAAEPILLFQKPYEGRAVDSILKWQCGALNIGACRIRTDANDINRRDRPSVDASSDSSTYNLHKTQRNPTLQHGRWPANVLLGHSDGCRYVGTKRVKGIGGGKSSGDNAFGQDSGWNDHNNRPTEIARQLDADGLEEVAAWECEAGCPVGMFPETTSGPHEARTAKRGGCGFGMFDDEKSANATGTWPADSGGSAARFFAQFGGTRGDEPEPTETPPEPEVTSEWECEPGCPVGMFPDANSARASGNPNDPKRGQNHVATSYGQGNEQATNDYRDTGTAARFFAQFGGDTDPNTPTRFKYASKAGRRERAFYCRDCQGAFWAKDRESHGHGHVGADGKHTWEHVSQHPTVKPTDLISWLAKLCCPPGGTILDPFLGSGTTAVACQQEGMGCIGIERDPEYAAVAKMRVEAGGTAAVTAQKPAKAPDPAQKLLF